MNGIRTISRDPFARVEVVRRSERGGTCAWCGREARYRYGTQSDAGRTDWQVRRFCSIGCMRAFHG